MLGIVIVRFQIRTARIQFPLTAIEYWCGALSRPREETPMFGSSYLGKFFGIDFRVHGTFWLLPLFVVLSGYGAGLDRVAFDLLLVFAVFCCVALHEVGHALAARAYGIRTRDITLYPVGGVAVMESIPERPRHEVAVALAGPAVNVAIAGGLFLGIALGGFVLPWEHTPDALDLFVANVFWANVTLAAFNLLPAFPMDGGRVLRALLASRLSRLRATEVAVQVGSVVAGAMFVAGLVLGHIGLALVAVVVWMLGQGELAAVRARAARENVARKVREFFEPPVPEPVIPGTARDLAARGFTGIAWDEVRGVWVRWVKGVPVGELPA
jgi:Zn-dependent protease